MRTLERKGSPLTPKPSSCPSISHPRVTSGLCARAPRGSALNGLCRREGTKEHSGLCFMQSRLAQCKSDQKNTRVVVQPSRIEKGHGTKYKVEKKYFID